MNERFTFDVLEADKLSDAGYVYPEEVLKLMAEQINSGRISGTLVEARQDDGKIDPQKISHEVLPTSRVSDGKLVVDIKIIDTVEGRTLSDWIQSGTTKPAVSGYGSIDESGRVADDYRISSINFKRS